MKKLLPALLLLAALAAAAAAQAPSGDTYRLGDREVSIPPPAGFVEATSRSPFVKKFFEATEAPALDLLAVHLTTADMEKIARGEYSNLGFYTKISVSKNLRVRDVSQEYFSRLVATMRANSEKLLDFNRPEMRAQLKHQNKGLSDLLKENAQMDLSQPVKLGEIEGTPNSFGLLMLIKVTFGTGGEQNETMMVVGSSAVRVRGRVVWVYTYRAFKSDRDADELRAFTQRWLADILRANP